MARDSSDTTSISSRRELIEWFEAGIKSPAEFRLGTEHEKVPFYVDGHRPVPFAGDNGCGGIRALLEGMQRDLGWSPILDGDALIGLYDEVGAGAISLEPGGQFELSGAPLATVHETADEFDRHMNAIKAVAEPLGIKFLSLGMSPLWSRAQTPVMPKQPLQDHGALTWTKVGKYGRDMMFRTTYRAGEPRLRLSEADMVEKMRVSLALQPLFTALFANSPFTDGKPNGFLSMRSEIWRDTDKARTGMLPFAFENGMGFERYVDYALKVPMYFVKRGDHYHDVTGANFVDLLDGRLPQLAGERATLSDWANHLSTIFPEVRAKRFLEMRGADFGPGPHVSALAAIVAGLLYDSTAQSAAWELVRHWSADERETMRAQVPRLALNTPIGSRTLREVGHDALSIARGGLARRARRNAAGEDETKFLDPLDAIVGSGRTLAEVWLEKYNGAWGGSVVPAFTNCVL